MGISLSGVIFPLLPIIMTVVFIQITLKNKEILGKNNTNGHNMFSSRYVIILAISILSIVIYSIVEVSNFFLNFSVSNEMNYLGPTVIIYSFSLAILFYKMPMVK